MAKKNRGNGNNDARHELVRRELIQFFDNCIFSGVPFQDGSRGAITLLDYYSITHYNPRDLFGRVKDSRGNNMGTHLAGFLNMVIHDGELDEKTYDSVATFMQDYRNGFGGDVVTKLKFMTLRKFLIENFLDANVDEKIVEEVVSELHNSNIPIKVMIVIEALKRRMTNRELLPVRVNKEQESSIENREGKRR